MESVESRLWPIPAAAIVLAVALGIVLPRVDLLLDASLPDAVDSAVFNGGADTARSVLSSIAGSLITATSLTFSLTVIALQLASSQASPRVLRLFARDRQVQWTLAAFMGTFAYSITVLRSVRSPADDEPAFVPRISVTVAFLLTLLSVAMLIFFLAHLAKQLRVETMLKEIHAQTDEAMRLVSGRNRELVPFGGEVIPPTDAHAVLAVESGFITRSDPVALMQFAHDHDIVVQEMRQVGDNVVAGSVLARWWAQGEAHRVDTSDVDAALRDFYAIRFERVSVEDVRYGMQQIVDIALRALSPGLNDPTTAVHALGHLSAILTRCAAMSRAPSAAADDSGALRVLGPRPTAADDVRTAIAPIRHYGATHPAVVARLLQLARELSEQCENEAVRTVLEQELEALARQLDVEQDDPASARELKEETLAVRLALATRSHT
ncbi:DUF2254 domain-containing protein [Microbacterium sp. NPDC019599]|uniref:DUF2254 domain-containing protein n=1 Tax=Microbacterium sp. NPDC019599 TaxID=3154690 RepID=UPI0033E80996